MAVSIPPNAWYETAVNIQMVTTTFTFQASCSPSPGDCGDGFEIIAANSSTPYYPPGYNDSGWSSGSFSWARGGDGNGNINAGNTGCEADLPAKVGPREMSDLYVTRADFLIIEKGLLADTYAVLEKSILS
jgi:hypothetical protein